MKHRIAHVDESIWVTDVLRQLYFIVLGGKTLHGRNVLLSKSHFEDFNASFYFYLFCKQVYGFSLGLGLLDLLLLLPLCKLDVLDELAVCIFGHLELE